MKLGTLFRVLNASHQSRLVNKHALCLQRCFSVTANLKGSHDAGFAKAQADLKTLKEDPGNQVKLQLYGLFKQATTGVCNQPQPGMMDFVGKAKWAAWNSLGQLSQDQAKKQYIDLVAKLGGSQAKEAVQPAGRYKNILVDNSNNIFKITFNRPTKKNALSIETYKEIIAAFDEASKDSAAITVLTGTGDYYSSGNDLSNFQVSPDEMKTVAREGKVLLKDFINGFIDQPKPLIAVVNGPAIGVTVTTLALCDVVYASEKATFHTPFTVLGQTPEGCSSFVFPRLMGQSKASDMLLFNKKLTAHEAFERGLVSEVIRETEMPQIWARLAEYAKLPKRTMINAKKGIRDINRDTLHKVNEQECEALEKSWLSDECINAVMNFLQRKT